MAQVFVDVAHRDFASVPADAEDVRLQPPEPAEAVAVVAAPPAPVPRTSRRADRSVLDASDRIAATPGAPGARGRAGYTRNGSTVERTVTSSIENAGRLSEGELSAWRGFLRVHSSLLHQLDAELSSVNDLPLRSYEVLLLLEDAPEHRLRMSDLSRSVLLSPSGVTRLVDRLERDGLVARQRCPEDGRGYNAVLTAAGVARLREARATHLGGVRRLFLDKLGGDDLHRLAAYWDLLVPGAAGTDAEWRRALPECDDDA